MQSLTQQFLTFCRSKPADEEYEYCSNGDCAFAQFLIAQGMAKEPAVGPNEWHDASGDDRTWRPIPARIADAVIEIDTARPNLGRTFGALAERLAA